MQAMLQQVAGIVSMWDKRIPITSEATQEHFQFTQFSDSSDNWWHMEHACCTGG